MVRRMTNWGVTKTNNDRNLLRYSHTYSNGWFTYHGFCHNNNIFQNKWVLILGCLCHIFWTQMSEKSIKDRNGILDHSLRFSFQLICKDLPSGKFQRYISNQQSERDLPIFLQFLDLASNCDTSWSISRSKPWWSRCDRVFSGSGIFWSHFPLIARDI